MVALVVGGAAILLAHAVLAGTLDALERARETVRTGTRRANQMAWLQRALGSVVVGETPGRRFTLKSELIGGEEADEMRFTSVLRAEAGYRESPVVVKLERSSRLIAIVRPDSSPDTLTLGDGVVSFGVDVLLRRGTASAWIDEFISPSAPPVATRIRVVRSDGSGDTVLALMRGRP